MPDCRRAALCLTPRCHTCQGRRLTVMERAEAAARAVEKEQAAAAQPVQRESTPQQPADVLFNALDADGDGVVTRQEMREGLASGAQPSESPIPVSASPGSVDERNPLLAPAEPAGSPALERAHRHLAEAVTAQQRLERAEAARRDIEQAASQRREKLREMEEQRQLLSPSSKHWPTPRGRQLDDEHSSDEEHPPARSEASVASGSDEVGCCGLMTSVAWRLSLVVAVAASLGLAPVLFPLGDPYDTTAEGLTKNWGYFAGHNGTAWLLLSLTFALWVKRIVAVDIHFRGAVVLPTLFAAAVFLGAYVVCGGPVPLATATLGVPCCLFVAWALSTFMIQRTPADFQAIGSRSVAPLPFYLRPTPPAFTTGRCGQAAEVRGRLGPPALAVPRLHTPRHQCSSVPRAAGVCLCHRPGAGDLCVASRLCPAALYFALVDNAASSGAQGFTQMRPRGTAIARRRTSRTRHGCCLRCLSVSMLCSTTSCSRSWYGIGTTPKRIRILP